jgi:hypothetical protein
MAVSFREREDKVAGLQNQLLVPMRAQDGDVVRG